MHRNLIKNIMTDMGVKYTSFQSSNFNKKFVSLNQTLCKELFIIFNVCCVVLTLYKIN